MGSLERSHSLGDDAVLGAVGDLRDKSILGTEVVGGQAPACTGALADAGKGGTRDPPFGNDFRCSDEQGTFGLLAPLDLRASGSNRR
jgi:hypothetical protein